MSKEVTQVIKTDNGDGTGNVTVITTDENGKQDAVSKDYDNHFSYNTEENTITRATQEALDK